MLIGVVPEDCPPRLDEQITTRRSRKNFALRIAEVFLLITESRKQSGHTAHVRQGRPSKLRCMQDASLVQQGAEFQLPHPTVPRAVGPFREDDTRQLSERLNAKICFGSESVKSRLSGIVVGLLTRVAAQADTGSHFVANLT
jgi:hypothetical protein